MEFEHRDGGDGTGAVSLSPVRDNAPVDADGVFEVDEGREDFDDVHERLVEAGHTPIDGSSDADGADEDAAEADDSAQEAQEDLVELAVSDYTEEDLVEMGRDELRSIAAQYDDINGNASGDKLTEDLIAKRREEVDG